MFNWVAQMPVKLKIKTLKQYHSHYSGAFIIDLTYFTLDFIVCLTYLCFIVYSKQVNAG